MTFTCPVPQAGSHLAELVDRTRRSHERVVLTEHGQPAAVLISVDDLDELQRFQDDSDIVLCEAINARNEPGVPHDQFMASLDIGVMTLAVIWLPALGETDFRRLRLDQYRVLYEVTSDGVRVMHVGRMLPVRPA